MSHVKSLVDWNFVRKGSRSDVERVEFDAERYFPDAMLPIMLLFYGLVAAWIDLLLYCSNASDISRPGHVHLPDFHTSSMYRRNESSLDRSH